MKICTSVSDIWAKCGLNENDTYQKIRECNFRYIDFSFFHLSDKSPYMQQNWQKHIDASRNMMEAAGVSALQAHAPCGNLSPLSPQTTEALARATRRSIECCAHLGVNKLVLHAGGYPGMPMDEFLRFNIGYIRQFFDLMEKTGVEILIENLDIYQATLPVHKVDGVLALIKAANHPLVHACLDTGHLCIEGGAQFDAILALGSHLHALHISDNFGAFSSENQPWLQDLHLPPLFGRVDFDDVLEGLKAIGFAGAFSLELIWPHILAKSSAHAHNPRLQFMPPALAEEGFRWVHHMVEHMLTVYDCFEE